MFITNNHASIHFFRSFNILWPWLSARFSSVFYVFINSSNISKQSYFGCYLLYLSYKTSWTKFERLSIPNLDLSKKIVKVVINKDKFNIFWKLVALILAKKFKKKFEQDFAFYKEYLMPIHFLSNNLIWIFINPRPQPSRLKIMHRKKPLGNKKQ